MSRNDVKALVGKCANSTYNYCRVVLQQPDNSMMTEEGAWDTLKEADQLTIERSEGNVFHGFHEGKAFRQGPIIL